jgi:hypothetical protein
MLVKEAFLQLQPVPLSKTATKEKKIVPVDDKRYRFLRFRAIGNMEVDGLNGNFDGFSYEGFEDNEPGYGYKSFIGKRAHNEHNSSLGKKGSIGDLPDAYLNRFIYPEDVKEKRWDSLLDPKLGSKREEILNMPNQKDGSIEVLMRIDTDLLKQSFLESKTKSDLQRLIRMIDTGQKVYCSMGVNVEYSKCTSCGNKARFASDYCNHLTKGRKGSLTIVTANQVRDMLDRGDLRQEWLKHVVASKFDIDEILKGSSNKGIAIKNGEMNHKLSFFELSKVGQPAFTRGDALEKVANQNVDRDFLNKIRKAVGDDNIISIYSLLQEEGKISQGCQIKW